jgi:DNA-binding IclR family transcriptional regulator
LDDEEDELGIRCVGSAVLDDHHEAHAAISIVGTITEIPLERVNILGRLLRDATNELASQLA